MDKPIFYVFKQLVFIYCYCIVNARVYSQQITILVVLGQPASFQYIVIRDMTISYYIIF